MGLKQTEILIVVKSGTVQDVSCTSNATVHILDLDALAMGEYPHCQYDAGATTRKAIEREIDKACKDL